SRPVPFDAEEVVESDAACQPAIRVQLMRMADRLRRRRTWLLRRPASGIGIGPGPRWWRAADRGAVRWVDIRLTILGADGSRRRDHRFGPASVAARQDGSER